MWCVCDFLKADVLFSIIHLLTKRVRCSTRGAALSAAGSSRFGKREETLCSLKGLKKLLLSQPGQQRVVRGVNPLKLELRVRLILYGVVPVRVPLHRLRAQRILDVAVRVDPFKANSETGFSLNSFEG
jgi:hypothetical protein